MDARDQGNLFGGKRLSTPNGPSARKQMCLCSIEEINSSERTKLALDVPSKSSASSSYRRRSVLRTTQKSLLTMLKLRDSCLEVSRVFLVMGRDPTRPCAASVRCSSIVRQAKRVRQVGHPSIHPYCLHLTENRPMPYQWKNVHGKSRRFGGIFPPESRLFGPVPLLDFRLYRLHPH